MADKAHARLARRSLFSSRSMPSRICDIGVFDARRSLILRRQTQDLIIVHLGRVGRHSTATLTA